MPHPQIGWHFRKQSVLILWQVQQFKWEIEDRAQHSILTNEDPSGELGLR
jgi:hypothetical protein